MLPPWQRAIPADMLYWGVIPGGKRQSAELSSADRYAFEQGLPVDVDALHLCTAKSVTGDQIVIGIEPERLRQWLSVHATTWSAVWELVPSQLPPGIPAPVAKQSWSLLTDKFEPAVRRRARRVVWAGWVGAAAVATIFAVIGTERTVAWAHRESQRLSDETAAQVLAALPPSAGDPSTADERLVMAVRRLAASDLTPTQHLPVPHMLQKLVAALPPAVRLQIENLSVAPERVSVRLRVLDLVAAEQVHHAWQGIAAELHLRAEALQAQTQDGAAVAVITLVPDAP